MSDINSSVLNAKKRKWDEFLPTEYGGSNDKNEMEKHALILASLAQSVSGTLEEKSSDEETSSLSSEVDSERPNKKQKQKTESKKRIRTTPEQLRLLEKTYEREKIPSQSLREELSLKLEMTPRRVQVWFQNKRAKERRLKKTTKQTNCDVNTECHHQFVPTVPPKLAYYPVHTYPHYPTLPVHAMSSFELSPLFAYATAKRLEEAECKRLPPLRYITNEM